jgi:hypothetical protein
MNQDIPLTAGLTVISNPDTIFVTTARGGVSATLTAGSTAPVNVDTSNPSYAYTVTASITMIQQVNDNAGNSQSMSLTITAN